MTPVTRNLLFQRRQKRRVRRMASWCMATRCCSAWRCGAAAHGIVAHGRAVRSAWASGRGKIMPRCVLGRFAVARFRRGAFSGGNPWQVLRSMHPESGLGRENRQFVARFARHASEMSWLWQDMRAMHPKSPANSRLRIHRAKILPGRAPFRCTGPSNHARRANLAIRRRRSALAPATPAPPNSTEQHEPPTTTPPPSWQRTAHSIRGASGSHTANAPTPHRPATLRRQADVKSCAARAPQRQSATRGQPRRKRSRTPHQRQRPALQWRASARCRSKAQRGSLAANLDGCPQRQTARTPHARITSSLRRGFVLFHRRRAPTIHIYPPLLWRGFPADAPRTAAFPCHPGECRSAPCACHGVPGRNRLSSAPRQCGKHGNP